MLADTLKRHEAFWNLKETDRPLLGINVGFFVGQRFPRVMAAMREGPVRPEDIPVEAFLHDCDDLHESHEGLGDYPFVSAPFVGIPWLEAIAGCPIMASGTGFWAQPCVADWKARRWEESYLENRWTRKLIELMRALVAHADGRYGVAPTLMRGPSDIIAAMRGSAELAIDLMENPEIVMPSMHQAARLWSEVAKAQLAEIPESGSGYVAGDAALRVWAPEKVLWLQEDAISILSPRLFRDYILPIDRGLSDAFPCIAYHLHGTALWAIDGVASLPGVDAIELNLETAFCDLEGTFEGWKKIQAVKPVILWRAYADDYPGWLARVLREFPAKGLSIQVSANSPSEAEDAQRMFREMLSEMPGH